MTQQDNSPDAFVQAMEERRKDPSKKGRSLPDDFACRPLGFILLLLGALLFWMYTYLPITDAQAQAVSISFKGKWVFFQPFLFLLGAIYTVFGESASKILGPTTKPSKWGWILAVIAFVLGFVYLHQVETYLRTLGYPV